MKKILLLVLFALTLSADITLKFNADGSEALKFYYKDSSHIRLSMYDNNDRSDIYVIGKKTYIVSYDDGHLEIVDLDQMKMMMGAFGAMMGVQNTIAPYINVVERGASTNVAGIKAEKWVVEMKDADDVIQRYNVLVTNDKKITKAMKQMADTLTIIPNTEMFMSSLFEVEPGYYLISADNFKLTYVSTAKIDNSVFILPSKRATHHKPKVRTKTITKYKTVKKCVKWGMSSNDEDDMASGMKYASEECLKYEYVQEPYEVKVRY